ncbi:transporter substrate-binding domain-containing protein [Nevskia ramosa]|uniref:transporter substrate-binding domain-containing protein n=1 Tax=Nevskia ramosa TaxID=64002 RepID=UPI0023524900|nr:transporter substrate-binding domain-containing protein [Nevskia ramosa]
MRHALLLAPLFTLLLGLFGAPAATAADQALWEKSTLNQIIKRGELRVGLEAGYLPFEMRDKRGEIIGFDVDLAKLMARYMGVKVSFVNTQWDGIIPALLTDKFDILMSGMTITPERNLQVNFARPYITIGQTILLAKKHADTVKSVKDLNDPKYVIATKLGTTGDIAAKRFLGKAKLKTFETEADAALEVRNGRADAFVYDLPFNVVYIAQFKDSLVHLKEPFTKEPLGWAVRKGDPDFLNWLDHFQDQIRNDGSYDALYGKWFEGVAWLANMQGG